MSLRVLHLVHWLNRGGIECWVADFIRATDRSTIQMDVCCKGPVTGVLTDQVRASGAAVHHIPLGWNHRSFAAQLAKLLRDGKYDILHIHAGIFIACPARAANRVGVPVVTTFHSTSFSTENNRPHEQRDTFATRGLEVLRGMYARHSVREGCRRSSAIVMCSQAVHAAVERLLGRMPQEKTYIIPCGTTKHPGRDAVARQQVRQELNIDPAAPVAIHVGTFRQAKNHPGLLRVAKRVAAKVSGFKLLLAGDGPLRPVIEQQVLDLDLSLVATLLGSRSDVERLLSAADLMIFPSLWEGLPVSVIEAQIKGLPVVGSDIGPMLEATRNGVTSLLFPLADEQAMAEAACRILADADLAATMSSAAVNFARATFTMDATATAYRDIYKRCAQADIHDSGRPD